MATMNELAYRQRWYEGLTAGVTSILHAVLAVAIWNSIGETGTLNFPYLWPVLFAIGSMMSLVAIFYRKGWYWAITSAFITSSMWGRAWDLSFNIDEFDGRAWISIGFHAGVGALVFVAWLAVGGTVDIATALRQRATDDGSE